MICLEKRASLKCLKENNGGPTMTCKKHGKKDKF